MEVILLERIEKLGQMGDVVSVKPGFARNYLLPQKKALRANKSNLTYFDTQRAQLEANNLQRRDEAKAVAVKMDGLNVTIVRQAGESGQLYGSVSARDVADAIKAGGYTIERRQVNLDNPIKTLGRYAVKVSLHPEVTIVVAVSVARSLEEAERAAAAAAAAPVAQPEEEEAEPVESAEPDETEEA